MGEMRQGTRAKFHLALQSLRDSIDDEKLTVPRKKVRIQTFKMEEDWQPDEEDEDLTYFFALDELTSFERTMRIVRTMKPHPENGQTRYPQLFYIQSSSRARWYQFRTAYYGRDYQ